MRRKRMADGKDEGDEMRRRDGKVDGRTSVDVISNVDGRYLF